MENKPDQYYIAVEHLRVGMYIHLDLRWVEHNFPLNSFRIKNTAQIGEIKALGLTQIRIDPNRSTVLPQLTEASASEDPQILPQHASSSVPIAPIVTPAQHPQNQERLAFLNRQRIALDKCERQFARAALSLREINSNIHARPKEAYAEAADLVQDILTTILSDKDVAIHLMNDKADGEEMYFHALNVSVLAMMLGREIGLHEANIEQLGIGCLFHDAGKSQIPGRVLQATTPTRAEMNLIRQHCAYGADIAKRLGLSQSAIEVIMQHHECMDGTGYPHMLIGDEISPLARIAAIVNAYDNHCNQLDPADSMTPYAALSHMYGNERRCYDGEYLSVFIRCMGVYPPGSLVRLSDETIGLVIASNFGTPLRPRILIFDPSVPKNEAMVLDLQQQPDLCVRDSLRPGDIGRDVYEYLNPRTHMIYFFDAPKRDMPG
jgi:putative nucleotidyltransferase with HDIG domain